MENLSRLKCFALLVFVCLQLEMPADVVAVVSLEEGLDASHAEVRVAKVFVIDAVNGRIRQNVS